MSRVPLSVDVAAKVTGFPTPISATLVDISEAGCRLTARSVFITGSAIEFRLPLTERVSLTVKGKISRCTPTESLGTLEYGIEFLAFSDQDARALATFVGEESRRNTGAQSAARVETEFPIECLLAGAKNAVPAIAIDLGRGGMRVACDNPIPEGATLTVRFTLPSDPPGRELVMRGRVVQRKQQFREYHHSVAFLEPETKNLERIDRFMNGVSTR